MPWDGLRVLLLLNRALTLHVCFENYPSRWYATEFGPGDAITIMSPSRDPIRRSMGMRVRAAWLVRLDVPVRWKSDMFPPCSSFFELATLRPYLFLALPSKTQATRTACNSTFLSGELSYSQPGVLMTDPVRILYLIFLEECMFTSLFYLAISLDGRVFLA